MSTFLFNEIIFGPVRSRRLGISLGINLLPLTKKYCNYDCLYCECGWTCNAEVTAGDLPSRNAIKEALENKIRTMVSENVPPDVITFAGNGEPTIHPDFIDIIDDTLYIRNTFCKESRIAVLSNSTTLDKKGIVKALKKTDQAILKLDTALQDSYSFINRPVNKRSVREIINGLKNYGSGLILQTLFFKGSFEGKRVNNTTPEELEALFEAYREIKPDKIMIYTFHRDTPVSSLEKVSLSTLEKIGSAISQLGFEVEISE